MPLVGRDAADVAVARTMWLAGLFLLLPWLWLVSLCYFRRRWADPTAPPLLNLYLRRSALGALLCTAALLIWVVVWQVRWRSTPALAALSVWSAPASWWLT